jgi:hypothetical protein
LARGHLIHPMKGMNQLMFHLELTQKIGILHDKAMSNT